MPGSPALSASSRSMHSSDRTSPTSSRLGRIRRLSLTSSRSVISPVPSSPAWRVCIGTQSGCGNRSSKTSSTLTTRSPPGIAADRQLSRVVLPTMRLMSPHEQRAAAVAIYARISQDRERRRPRAWSRQLTDCRAEANGSAGRWPRSTSTTTSAPTPASARPALPSGCWTTSPTASVDAIIVWHMDRLHRRPIELEEFARGVRQAGSPTCGPLHGDVRPRRPATAC